MSDINQGPSLQKYFANDPPSLFDQIQESTTMSNLSAEELIETGLEDYQAVEEKCPIADEVKFMWNYIMTDDVSRLEVTAPTISITNEMPDPILQSVVLNCPEESAKRKILSANDVTQDAVGIRHLVEKGCLRSAINLTTRLLTVYGYDRKSGQIGKNTPHSLQLWFTRLSLLMKVGEYEACSVEAQPFEQLNKPDVFIDYKDPQTFQCKKKSIACFSLRLLLAVLPLYCNKPRTALKNLMKLLEVTKKIRIFFEKQEKEKECNFWKQREILIMNNLINCGLVLKNFDLVHQIFEELKKLVNSSDDDRFLLFSAWGRVYLQSGDIANAEKMFTESRKFNKNSKFDKNDLIDRALVAVAQNDYQKGFGCFQKALTAGGREDEILIQSNMAVCCLYSGKLDEAIKLYENAIANNPKKATNENILLNLSTLYELQSNDSKTKKVEILKIINQHRADLYTSLDSSLKL